jgi:hypothetical protein
MDARGTCVRMGEPGMDGPRRAVRRSAADRRDALEQDRDIGSIGKDGSNWLSDVRGSQSRSRHLIEQGLEEMEISAVNQRDLCRRATQ